MDKQINHDNYHDEQKTRTHRLSKPPDDGDPWAQNNLLTPEQKKKTPVEPQWTKQQTGSSGSNQLKRIAFCRGHHKVIRPNHRYAIKGHSIDINHDWVKN